VHVNYNYGDDRLRQWCITEVYLLVKRLDTVKGLTNGSLKVRQGLKIVLSHCPGTVLWGVGTVVFTKPLSLGTVVLCACHCHIVSPKYHR
jgi:hypothetical protein